MLFCFISLKKQMQDLLNQIKLGIKNKLYYLSLFVVLTIPDIC